ncbi:hypothetical protein V6N12_076309 [Hibiscus sabdariffa]|uniref:RNase H type-1 domain-containing protein n=1 Tax=Hibiscus sabdariffa TaxID=183260 RepID=A0ABR2D9T3_9ROSI
MSKQAKRISFIKLPLGEWTSDEDLIHAEAIGFFRDLYSSQGLVPGNYPLSGCFPSIPTIHMDLLELVHDHEEIRDVLFAMLPLKSPGVDGLHAQFFQKHWDIVGPSISPVINDELLVCDVVDAQGSWNWPLISNLLVPEAVDHIMNVNHPTNIAGHDCCYWKPVDCNSSYGKAGSVIRDANGEWFVGFHKYLGISHPLHAELWGILEGLRVAWSYGLERIQCQTDCAEAFKLISSEDSHNNPI